jgi:hypothetical protein
MGSPVNDITTFTYLKGDFMVVQTTALKLDLPNVVSHQINFPTNGVSKGSRYILSKNFLAPESPPFGLLVTDVEKPDQSKKMVAESFATLDNNNTVVFEEGWSMSDVQINGGEVVGYTLSYSSAPTPPPKTLQELLNHIHTIRTPSELNSELNSIKSKINDHISGGDSFQKNYYKNHTGRELFRKLYNYGLSELIPTTYDGGFRPDDQILD